MKKLFSALSLAAIVSAGCSHNAARKDPGLGMRVIDCVVVEREQGAPAGNVGRFSGSGGYYLVFEGREGQATSHYRFEVTRQQWFRFPEGSRVKITLNNDILQDIQPNE
jgi:hypothetical protein